MDVTKITATAGMQEDYGERKAQVTVEAELTDDEDVNAAIDALLNKARDRSEEAIRRWRPER
jgi:hypothetical protein